MSRNNFFVGKYIQTRTFVSRGRALYTVTFFSQWPLMEVQVEWGEVHCDKEPFM